MVSIPFIAGQWSLRQSDFPLPGGPGSRFNPLHCGAVVASRRGNSSWPAPLPVSIPFIAGQWSLLVVSDDSPERAGGFQSPSLRGSGRFHPSS